jgi:hypothetical protein
MQCLACKKLYESLDRQQHSAIHQIHQYTLERVCGGEAYFEYQQVFADGTLQADWGENIQHAHL